MWSGRCEASHGGQTPGTYPILIRDRGDLGFIDRPEAVAARSQLGGS
jgi:hypothetical protein